MNGTPKRLAGPAYVAASVANVYNPASGTLGYVTQVEFYNAGTGIEALDLFLGASGGSSGSTALLNDFPLPAKTRYPITFYPALVLTSSDFLTAATTTGSTVTVTVLGLTVTT